jgi:putative hydrolase
VPLTPGQTAALARVELLLTLVEGWIDHIATIAIADRIGTAVAIREALRRRRAAGGPSEKTFSQLIGLELRPKKLREASEFWAGLDAAKRDSIWQHPDFLPSVDDLDNPEGFVIP